MNELVLTKEHDLLFSGLTVGMKGSIRSIKHC